MNAEWLKKNSLLLSILLLLVVLTASSCVGSSALVWSQWKAHQAMEKFKKDFSPTSFPK